MSIFIPRTIRVGFQKRYDTFTGKLSYIIYYDEKGKLRKEPSWNSWRDESLGDIVAENSKTEGFVLNKTAGGLQPFRWNDRKTYCRVYDPRGFEFEILIDNLFYILDYSQCLSGKRLEGEFVYGWDEKNLILIPCASPEYEEISKRSDSLFDCSYIKPSELKVGFIYENRKGKKYIYCGRYYHYSYCYTQHNGCGYVRSNGKKYWFLYLGCQNYQISEASFDVYSSVSGKFINVASDEPHKRTDELIRFIEEYQSRYAARFQSSSSVLKDRKVVV